MNRIAIMRSKEREELFLSTARAVNLPEAIAEKDFWVCWTLDYLFRICPIARHLLFKGGTSLSKCFGLIERFSEDIDVVLDWRLLGYRESEPWMERSRSKQERFNKEAEERCARYLDEALLPRMKEDFLRILPDGSSLYIDNADPQTICFAFPRIFAEDAILSVVRIEIGALAAWSPFIFRRCFAVCGSEVSRCV